LKKTEPRQLSLVLADSPSGGGSPELSDASERRSFLLHKARTKKTTGSATGVADVRRLLEEVASEANLAKALLSVVRNKGGPHMGSFGSRGELQSRMSKTPVAVSVSKV